MSSRTTDLFAATAQEDGVVTEVTKRGIKITYKSGEVETVELGKRFGSAAGLTFPHDVVTSLSKGDKVKYGDTIAYNRKFFAEDSFNPGGVVWKAGVMVRTALIDDIDTLEDGSSISAETAKKLTTQTTEIRNVEVRFDQYIHDMVQVGDHVDLDSILCTIEDPETAENPLFDTAASDTLKRLTAMTPRAKTTGTVSKIDCFYHGEFEDLSPNLQVIAEAANKTRRLQAKALGHPPYDGQVDTSFRVKGNALDPDVLVLQVYIDHDVSCNKGDRNSLLDER